MAKNRFRLRFKGKVVLERADFNVPIKDGEITNDNRIVPHYQQSNILLNKVVN